MYELMLNTSDHLLFTFPFTRLERTQKKVFGTNLYFLAVHVLITSLNGLLIIRIYFDILKLLFLMTNFWFIKFNVIISNICISDN